MDKIFRKHMNALRNEVQDYLTTYQAADAAQDEARTDHAKAAEGLKRYNGNDNMTRYRLELIEGGLRIAQKEAEDKFQQIRKSRFDLLDRAAEIRAQLRAELETASLADPAAVNSNVCRLLDSGILTAKDYQKLFSEAQDAGNVTMMRLIGQKAHKAAEAAENVEDREVLSGIFHDSKNIIRDKMDTFDGAIFGLSCATGTPENPRELSPGTMKFWLEETAE